MKILNKRIPQQDLGPAKATRKLAMYIAAVVRNTMEDFHCQPLSDDQMKQLNPLIRDAICTALHAYKNYERSVAARRFVDFNLRLIPTYWEEPKLTEDFLRCVKSCESKDQERAGVDWPLSSTDL